MKNITKYIYSDSSSKLSAAVEPYIALYGASGWARQETVKQGPGEYAVTFKNVVR